MVRKAVARSESVFLIPHFARIEVSPAKTAERIAVIIQSIFIPRLTNLSITYSTIFRQSKQYLKQKLHIRF